MARFVLVIGKISRSRVNGHRFTRFVLAFWSICHHQLVRSNVVGHFLTILWLLFIRLLFICVWNEFSYMRMQYSICCVFTMPHTLSLCQCVCRFWVHLLIYCAYLRSWVITLDFVLKNTLSISFAGIIHIYIIRMYCIDCLYAYFHFINVEM